MHYIPIFIFLWWKQTISTMLLFFNFHSDSQPTDSYYYCDGALHHMPEARNREVPQKGSYAQATFRVNLVEWGIFAVACLLH